MRGHLTEKLRWSVFLNSFVLFYLFIYFLLFGNMTFSLRPIEKRQEATENMEVVCCQKTEIQRKKEKGN